ncbi:MAG: sensor histidine kinase [Chloroflexota bacterium]|nr:sensor histidine kinase [Chloroflexota bacterium]
MNGQTAIPWTDDAMLEASGDAVYRVLPRWMWRLFSAVWLFFLIFPIIGLLHPLPAAGRALTILAGMVVIAALYLRLMLHRPFPGAAFTPAARWQPLALLILLVACVLFLTLTDSSDWYWFFTYTGLAAGVAFPARWAAWMTIGLIVVTAGVGGTVDWLQMGRMVVLVAVLGSGMIGVGYLIRTIRALRAARAEIARLAVAEERLRFARDLHDLLGHSLSTIAIKTALAHRLLSDAPERAGRELEDVQTVTQEALKEVRDAVTGYRQPTLATELANAQEILAAAGIACDVDDAVGTLPAAVESALAWTVREGVTNIVRHSRARHVTIGIHQGHETVRADITDDGEGDSVGTHPSPSAGGSGLRGLAERAVAVGGRLDAQPCPTGGFHLVVILPLIDIARHTIVTTDAGKSR